MAIFEVDGIRIAYDRHGETPSNPAVVFLHAFPLNRLMWEPQVDEFSGTFDLIVPDMRGHGASDVTIGAVTMDRMAEDVHALVTSLDVAPVALVGISMGGYVALAYMRRFADTVAGLVLVDTRATPDTDEARAGRYAMIEDVAENGAHVVASAMLPKLLSPEVAEEDPDLVANVRRMIETTAPAGIAGALAGMAERADSRNVLPQIRVPTLVIVGAEDVVTPPEDARSMADAIPNARLEVLEGAGHLSNLERPDAFNTVLGDFLGSLEPEFEE